MANYFNDLGHLNLDPFLNTIQIVYNGEVILIIEGTNNTHVFVNNGAHELNNSVWRDMVPLIARIANIIHDNIPEENNQ